MSEDERLDIVEGVDEDGNRLLLRVNRYFYYNGEEYVLLSDDIDEVNDHLDEVTFFVMKVSVSTDERSRSSSPSIRTSWTRSSKWSKPTLRTTATSSTN